MLKNNLFIKSKIVKAIKVFATMSFFWNYLDSKWNEELSNWEN